MLFSSTKYNGMEKYLKWEDAKKQFAHTARIADVKYNSECDKVSIRAQEYSGGAYKTYEIGKYFSRLRSVHNECMGKDVLGDEGNEKMEAMDYDEYISEEEEEDNSSLKMCRENNGVKSMEQHAVICGNGEENGTNAMTRNDTYKTVI